jgi:hypothetical protein
MSMAESFARTGIARFINSPVGRVVRIVVGLALIGYGYTRRAETTGMVLVVVGLAPLAAGSFNLCLVSALLGGPLSGAKIGKSG